MDTSLAIHPDNFASRESESWADIGALTEYRRQDCGCLFRCEAGQVAVTFYDENTVRVTMNPGGEPELNPAYLSRLFRKETGMVLTDYILQEKMRRASELLVLSDSSISEIADSLGYGNFSYFARLFRKVYGVTPHEYRKSLRRTS